MKNIAQPPVGQLDLQRHEQWLREWNLYKRLALTEKERKEQNSYTFPADLNPPDKFTAGSILELSPEIVPSVDHFFYVVILGYWGDSDRVMIVPFSPFSVPATSTEYLVMDNGGNNEHCVLELWNMRIVEKDAISKSLVAGKLLSEDVEAAKAVWLQTIGDMLPAHIRVLTGGVPIDDENDPRCEYQVMEIKAFEKLDVRAAEELLS